ncbi:MAG: oxygen-dependent coproporphyrinogen oxidase [Myxococcales bacterium]|nr:oxygen-dependent coproporphyrinogen oxidase [Myxococcales bacterium]
MEPPMTEPLRARAAAYFRDLQHRICTALETLEPTARFRSDVWKRDGGGGGDSRVLEGGDFLEKGGVNFSEVHGELPADFAAQLPGEGTGFWAAGVSLVLHPQNPYVPTVHANFRMIAQGGAEWFGGGADLTPYYPEEDDVRHFHRTLRDACAAHDPRFHPEFKAWCDRYFYLPHREEPRGVGGIFFDHLTPEKWGHDLEALFAFVRSAGDAFVPAYLPIAEKRRHQPYGKRERAFQCWRRGRYVEFNLMYDRGTIFGLRTKGRIESILMSLPPVVHYRYDHRPEGAEARLAEFLVPRDWAADPS